MVKLIMTSAFLLIMYGNVQAQEPECPPPTMTGETLKARLLELAAIGDSESGASISRMVRAAIGPASGCPLLGDAEDVQPVLDDLIRFAALENDRHLNIYFFRGLLGGLGARELVGLRIPLEALQFAVEEARSGPALQVLLRLAEDDEVHAYLLRLARARRGPPGWSALPEGIVEVIFRFPSDEDARLRAELAAAPSRIPNPTARCRVENRGRSAHTPPVCP